MSARTDIHNLPPELLDDVFSHLRGDYSRLRVFLFDQHTYSAAVRALWHTIDLSNRLSYGCGYNHTESMIFSDSPSIRHEYRSRGGGLLLPRWLYQDRANAQQLFTLDPGRFQLVHSLKIDVPSLGDLPFSADVRIFLQRLGTNFPRPKALDVAFKAKDDVSHLHPVEDPIELPPTVRELTINRPDCFRMSATNMAEGKGLDMLTIRTTCCRCDSRMSPPETWRHYEVSSWLKKDLGAADEIWQNLKAFRFERPGSPHNKHALCDGPVLEKLMLDKLIMSKDGLERIEFDMPSSFARQLEHSYRDDLPFWARQLHLYTHLRTIKVSAVMFLELFFLKLTPVNDIVYEVVLDPRLLELRRRGHLGVTDDFIDYIRVITKIKVLLDLEIGGDRKINFILEDKPQGSEPDHDWVGPNGTMKLVEWYTNQLNSIGRATISAWLESALPRSASVNYLLPPDQYCEIDSSTESLREWVQVTEHPFTPQAGKRQKKRQKTDNKRRSKKAKLR